MNCDLKPRLQAQSDNRADSNPSSHVTRINAYVKRAQNSIESCINVLYCKTPQNTLHGVGRVLDRRLAARFDYYIQEVAQRLPQINRVLAGEAPAWLPDCPPVAIARERIAAHAPELVACRLPLPGDLFEGGEESGLRRAA